MAGITADANESVGGASDLGFANPFIYNWNGTGLGPATSPTSRAGTTATAPARFWPATNGFDMVTGRGSVNGAAFAAALAGYTPAVITFHSTKLTATHPLNLKRVKKGASVTFSGVLTNTTSAQSARHRQMLVVASNGNMLGVDRTGRSGGWEIVIKVKKRLTWHAVFMGSAHEKGSVSRSRTVRIKH